MPLALAVIAAVLLSLFATSDAAAQFPRPKTGKRIQRKPLGKLIPNTKPDEPRSETVPKQETSRDLRPNQSQPEISRELQKIFTPQERALVIPGFASPVAQMLINRELGLDEQQRADLTTFAQEIGERLIVARKNVADHEVSLAQTLYGPNFDPKQIEQFASETAARQSEVAKLNFAIEARLRKILKAEQIPLYRVLHEQLVAPPRFRPQMQQSVNKQIMTIMQNRFPPRERQVVVRGLGNPIALALIFRTINLAVAQRGQLIKLNFETGNELIRLNREREEAERDLEFNRNRETYDFQKAEELQTQMVTAQTTLMTKRAAIESQIRQILTPEQWTLYRELLRGLVIQAPVRLRK